MAAAIACAAVVAGTWRHPAAQSPSASVCAIETTERIVAIGDVHGAYDRFTAILRAAGVIDGRERWIGGRSLLVQTGDLLDRGPDSRKALDLMRKLEQDAARAGGRVHPLLGNHEVMRMIGDWRYVSAGEIAAFRTADSEELRERAFQAVAAADARRGGTRDEKSLREKFMQDVPLGYIEMQQAFDPRGEYGKWLRSHDAIVRINGIAFVHGGTNLTTASLGCEAINATVRRETAAVNPSPEAVASMLASSDTGPLWYRGLVEEPESSFGPEVTTILEKLGVRAIVIGHTVAPAGRIRSRFGGRVIQIDTGMLDGTFYPGGAASALEIRGDTVTAIYTDHRDILSVPARASSSVSR
jgi:hypothetical protein